MKYYSLLFLVLLITSCSNEWKELGFSETQENNAKEMGFENPLDYQESLDLGLSFDELMAYRNGKFNDIEQFNYARKYNLKTISEVYHTQLRCVITPTDGLVCPETSYKPHDLGTSYGELGSLNSRFEYHLAQLNKKIDASKIEIALDCSSVHPSRTSRKWRGHYRTVFIKASSDLIPYDTKRLVKYFFANRDTLAKYYRFSNVDIQRKSRNSDQYDINNSDVMAIISYEFYKYRYNDGTGYIETNEIKPWKVIIDGSWQANDDSYSLITPTDGRFDIDRKTGEGIMTRIIRRSVGIAWKLRCEAFEGDVKTYLINDVLKAPIKKAISEEIEALNKQKAGKKAEEERNSMENKF
tara:strand:- start:94 stop:1155 length:1062 start_codon:yes stop_codon:yes gene_type:complete